MADETPAPGRKGFNIRKPGPKEYIIVIAGTLGAYLLITKLRGNKTAAASSGTTGTGTTDTGSSGPAGGAAALWLWMLDHAGSTTTKTTSTVTEEQGSGGGTGARVKLTKAEAQLLREAGVGSEIGRDGSISRDDYDKAFTGTDHTARPWLLQRLQHKAA